MFPTDTKTFNTEINGVGSSTISNTTSTVLSIRIQQSGTQSESEIKCGDVLIGKNYGVRDYGLDLLNFRCFDILYVNKTGMGDKAFFSVSYVPRDIAITGNVSQTFTYGEILNGVFLFTGLIFMLFFVMIYFIRGLKVYN